MKAHKDVLRKEQEEGVLLKGLEQLVSKISGQNIDYLYKYTENMTTLVSLLKESIIKIHSNSSVFSSAQSRVAKLTKPVKVPIWSRNMSLETFIKQLETWSELNEEVPEFMKYNDLVESLKQNKDIKDLPHYVAEHVFPVLDRKTD